MYPPLATRLIVIIVTGRYLIYSEADFEVCRPTGTTRCTNWVKFDTEKGT